SGPMGSGGGYGGATMTPVPGGGVPTTPALPRGAGRPGGTPPEGPGPGGFSGFGGSAAPGAPGGFGGGMAGGAGGRLGGPPQPDQFFKNFDRQNTGKIRREDVPEWMRERFFEMLDTNKDGVVDQDEFRANYGKLWETAGGRRTPPTLNR